MKSKLILLALIGLVTNLSYGQLDSTIYGITRDGSTQELYLSKINPLNGIVTNISTSSFTTGYIGNALATIDPINELFYLNSQDTLFGIDLNSGNVVYNSYVSTPFTGYFDMMKFNCSDTAIYGITRDGSTQELYLSRINPLNGIVTNISTSSFTTGYIWNALAIVDPINELFYLNSQDTLFGIDLNSGNVVYNSYVSTPITGYFDLMNFFPTQCNSETTTGIKSNSYEIEPLSIYPNPTNGSLNIKNHLSSEFEVDLYKIDGKLLKSFTSGGNTIIEVNLIDYKSGVMILVVRDNSNIITIKKIVKN